MPSNSKAAKPDDINYVGFSAGAMMQTPSDASADEVHSGIWRLLDYTDNVSQKLLSVLSRLSN